MALSQDPAINAKLDELATRDARGHALDGQIAALEARIGADASALSEARAAAGDQLAAAIATASQAIGRNRSPRITTPTSTHTVQRIPDQHP